MIRPESPGDVEAIHALTAAAFLNGPHTSHTEHLIVDALRAAEQLTLSLVHERDGALIGHVAVSPVTIRDGSRGWFGLGPISVLPEHQGQGVGSELVRAALERLREEGAQGCVLLGEPAYYGRFGFRAVPGLVLPGVPPEYFQALAFDAPLPHGEVAYHEAFDVLPPDLEGNPGDDRG
ncbi:N-acetyltransferase [Hydrogenophaga sp. 2FB]|uniref:GNAT family N-acetyltransferase n=1 Tax=Hydrogenophaga sp. 2FB TaxID=2502187 RepID=UPI0010F561A0|nr:N-acetyltransferase [Hydrogenophaga sp. 2FB]